MITLATLSQATAQEVFDQVVNHLLTQNARSAAGDSSCYYRHLGMKCAAGCLISEEEMAKIPNGAAWANLVKNNKVPEDHAGLIRKLQIIHDTVKVSEWLDALKGLAFTDNLKFNWSPA